MNKRQKYLSKYVLFLKATKNFYQEKMNKTNEEYVKDVLNKNIKAVENKEMDLGFIFAYEERKIAKTKENKIKYEEANSNLEEFEKALIEFNKQLLEIK